MRKVGDLMKELGFRHDASNEVKVAFIKNLFRAAYGFDLKGPTEKPGAASIQSIRMSSRDEALLETTSNLEIDQVENNKAPVQGRPPPLRRKRNRSNVDPAQLSFDFESNPPSSLGRSAPHHKKTS